MHTSAIKFQAKKFVQPHFKSYCLIMGPIYLIFQVNMLHIQVWLNLEKNIECTLSEVSTQKQTDYHYPIY